MSDHTSNDGVDVGDRTFDDGFDVGDVYRQDAKRLRTSDDELMWAIDRTAIFPQS